MTDPALPSIGTILGQKYRIESVIGEGGMGVVFAATHEKLGQPVAIKMLLPEFACHAELVARFGREARAAAQLRHRNSARVIDVDETSTGIPYMVMERLHGHDLEMELEARGKLTIPDAIQFVVEACSAMAEAHARGIVHRDLKPSNLFLSNEADGTVCVKVLDFGISKVQNDDGRITSTQHQMGTPLYMSPEQVRSVKSVDSRTDVWSLGVILYELLSGETPFKGSTAGIGAAIVGDTPPPLRELRPEIPADLEEAVFKAMAKSPNDRFASMQEMIAALVPFGSPSSIKLATASRPRFDSLPSAVSSPSLVEAATLAAPPAAARTADPPESANRPNATAGSWVKVKSRGDGPRRTTWLVGGGLVAAVGVSAFFILHTPAKTITNDPQVVASASNALAQPPATPSANVLGASEPPATSSVSTMAVPSASASSSPSASSQKPHGSPSSTKPATAKPPPAKPGTTPLNENPARL